jgi:hypothetical protein
VRRAAGDVRRETCAVRRRGVEALGLQGVERSRRWDVKASTL